MRQNSLGTVTIAKPDAFATTLEAGTPIMVNVFPGNAGSHQVVLTRTFTRGTERWYEMIDSNAGPIRRLYLKHSELTSILKENGIIYRPDDKTVPLLLK